MTPTRLRLVFKMISLAIDMGTGDLAKQVVAYGAHFKITAAEAHLVLKMPLSTIYAAIHGIQSSSITAGDTQEIGPLPERREEL